jgi:hypothetical protein
MNKKKDDYLEMLDYIVKTLKKSGYNIEADKIEHEIGSSFTSTELCLRSGSILMGFKSRLDLRELVGDEIEDFLNFCNIQGLHIKPGPK